MKQKQTQVFTCDLCKQSLPISQFAPTSSPFFPSGRINLCFGCVESNLDQTNLNQVDRFLQHCNIAFYPNEWRKMHKRDPVAALRTYTNTYYDMKYVKHDWGTQNTKLQQLAREGLIDTQLEELEPQLIAELRATWGNLDTETLKRLERYYNSSLNDYNVQIEAHRDLLRKICRLSIMIDDDLAQGIVDKDKITQYERLMSTMMKTLEEATGEGISSIGEIVTFMEQNGFQPNFYSGVPRDEMDLLMENMQEYVRDLVLGEVNLTELYEGKKRAMERTQE